MSTRPSVAPDNLSGSAAVQAFAADLEYYLALRPRQLPSRYLYDPLGTALFEAICELPWYRITRAERQLLDRHGREILARVSPLSTLIELGPGSGEKLAVLVKAGQLGGRHLAVHLVDVSAAALELAERTLARCDAVDVIAHQATYEVGLGEATNAPRLPGRLLTVFLGSNIGNFDPPGAAAFLRRIHGALATGDALLLGTDLEKPEPDLLRAYDDPLGVTAAFNRNLLVRINRELGGDFDLEGFAHRAVWNSEHSRVEMHLVARRAQRVRIAATSLDIAFEEGETIWTESSYKYRPGAVIEMLERVGFRPVQQWIDHDARFALTLVEAA